MNTKYINGLHIDEFLEISPKFNYVRLDRVLLNNEQILVETLVMISKCLLKNGVMRPSTNHKELYVFPHKLILDVESNVYLNDQRKFISYNFLNIYINGLLSRHRPVITIDALRNKAYVNFLKRKDSSGRWAIRTFILSEPNDYDEFLRCTYELFLNSYRINFKKMNEIIFGLETIIMDWL